MFFNHLVLCTVYSKSRCSKQPGTTECEKTLKRTSGSVCQVSQLSQAHINHYEGELCHVPFLEGMQLEIIHRMQHRRGVML